MGKLDPRRMMIIPVLKPHFWTHRNYGLEEERGREKPLDGKSIVRQAVYEWGAKHGPANMEAFVDTFAEIVGRQMELRRTGSQNSERSEAFLKKLREDLKGVEMRITMMIHDDTHYEVGIPPGLPKELDSMLGNKTCGRCKTFLISGTWVAHTEFECNTKIVQNLMAK